MNVELETINPIDYPEWDDFLISNQDYSVFHSSGWARVISDSYHYNPLYITLVDREKLLALVPIMEINSVITGRRGVSLPFTDYCEPFISEESYFTDAFSYITNLGERSRWRYIELRGGQRFFKDIPSFSYYYNHTLRLTEDVDQLFSAFRGSTKRNIKKATREGVEVTISHSLESMKDFYKLHCLTRKYHGLPPQPFYFFESLYDHLMSKDKGIVVAASYNNKTIASAVFFHFGEKAIYKFGASDRTYQHLRANNLVMWNAIKWYSQNGYKVLDMGRTSPDNKGLIQFKASWNPLQSVMKYYKYNIESQTFAIGNSKGTFFAEKLFQNMPISLSRLIGTLAYKHIG